MVSMKEDILERERVWLVVSSLIAAGSVIAFLAVAPAVGYPLERSQASALIQTLVPVFTGYLASAAAFLLGGGRVDYAVAETHHRLLVYLVRGPVYLFAGILALVLAGFGWSNSSSAPDGSGMSYEDLRTVAVVLLSILTASTGALTIILFGRRDANMVAPNSAHE